MSTSLHGARSTSQVVALEDVVEWLRGDLAGQLLIGPPGQPHDPPLTETTRLEMLAEDFEAMVDSTEIPSFDLADAAIVVYRRMEAAAAGARVERDIMRTAIEGIAAGDDDPVGIARAALATDRARREANLAALDGRTR